MIGKLGVLLVLMSPASAGMAQAPSVARQIFTTDSITVGDAPTISPDERWLIFARTISNQESRVMIRPMAGGEIRELITEKGLFSNPRFTPKGDRLLFTSDLPRRGAGDNGYYIVGAPFDTRTGALTGPMRQVSLDAIEPGRSHVPGISPDGRWVSYQQLPSKALKIVPIEGGHARTLVGPGPGFSYQTWAPDGKSILYEAPQGREFVRMRVSLDGGSPIVVLKSLEHLGFLSADTRYSFTIDYSPGNTPRGLHVFGADGRYLATVELPKGILAPGGFVVSGKYLLATRINSVAPIMVVPVGGGPMRQITSGETYDWAFGWSPDGEAVYVSTEKDGRPVMSLVTRTGQVRSSAPVPETGGTGAVPIATQDGHALYMDLTSRDVDGRRIMIQDLKDGSRRELVRNVRRDGGVTAPGGMYWELYGGEFYFIQMKAGRWQIRAMNLRGESRLVGEVPADGVDGRFAVYQNRIAYVESVGDSARIKVIAGPGRTPSTLGTFPKPTRFGEQVWSYDGRQLAVRLQGNPILQLIYRFDAAGAVVGTPQSFALPFEYWYETFWLPDGSGLTMIGQPPGMPMNHIALVKLSDPEHPVLLTRADTNSKWGHSLSPDGKYVAYASERERGSSIYLIDMAELVKQALAKP